MPSTLVPDSELQQLRFNAEQSLLFYDEIQKKQRKIKKLNVWNDKIKQKVLEIKKENSELAKKNEEVAKHEAMRARVDVEMRARMDTGVRLNPSLAKAMAKAFGS